MRTARLARCSVPFASGRGRGCGMSPRLTVRCDERGAMELEHIEPILSRSTHPPCIGHRSRRLRALLMRFWLAHPPLIHIVPRPRAARFLRSAQSRYRLRLREEPSRAEPGEHGLRLALWESARRRRCMRAFVEAREERRRVEERGVPTGPGKHMVGEVVDPYPDPGSGVAAVVYPPRVSSSGPALKFAPFPPSPSLVPLPLTHLSQLIRRCEISKRAQLPRSVTDGGRFLRCCSAATLRAAAVYVGCPSCIPPAGVRTPRQCGWLLAAARRWDPEASHDD
ncbi:hypothetical protein B0H13DRAFT_2525966 [Mycena leptocephala]|nr:hypothetical protein B0H13DRAFT_2525966 [Mycena leptocephala]